jgi:hypothetical protein
MQCVPIFISYLIPYFTCVFAVVVYLLPSNQKSNKNVHNAVILYSTTWASKLFMAKTHPLLWPSSQVTRGEITVSDILNRLSNCAIFTVFSQFTNVTVGGIIQLAGCMWPAGRGLETFVLLHTTTPQLKWNRI